MLREVIGRVRSLFGAEKTDEEDHLFRPSRLDRSVLSAHGGGRETAEQELQDIQENAHDLEAQRRT